MTRDELEKLNYDELKHQFYNKITSLKKDYLFYYGEIEKLNKEFSDKINGFENLNIDDLKNITKEDYDDYDKRFKKVKKEADDIKDKIKMTHAIMEGTEKTIEKLRAISNLTI